ncbi:aspartate transaminase [Bradyrhizobium sp. WYCCWR 13023]|uniref:Aminotransferase n=1 Tax=Bradyrhizobium zhengyangense TaxID=2911009 RepID=A0A9X1UFQ2_9BRAD|nr:aspartate transaminase [Bradyrhizobium zhengyangense]MCG2626732.1 aspartate transaminase [Bradyrhizobium zhengyangense]MCG2638181.1 aspartate transaminase [Bradyrhizobium zhengyangense]MCG2666580.1 aspartate transaminase [Bradyrhizobium zhengyangense]
MNHPRISARVRRIKPSPSSAAADRATALKREGKNIVSLVVGEPDFDTPANIRAAASKAMDKGATRYTMLAGSVDLRQAIAAKLKRENNLVYSPSDIIVTNGCKSGIYSALEATIEAGDEVIIPAPYWVSYPDMVIACDGVPKIVACPESQGFKISPAQLEAAITDKTRWLIINSPSNPTGASYSAAEYRKLADVLARHPHMLVMTDDIYEHIRFDGRATPHLLNAAPELADRVLAVNGVSKTYAMTGWRIGWIAGPSDLIGALNTLLSQAAGNACSISQAAAVEALNGDQSFVSESVAMYRTRRDRMLTRINQIEGLSCLPPDGAFYLYVNCAALIGRSTPAGARLETDGDVAMYLLESVGVAVVQGSAYGLSPYFRISIAASLDVLDDGTNRIAHAVSELR